MKLQDEVTISSSVFKLTDAQFEEIWERFVALETANNGGKPVVNLLGSVTTYKQIFKKAAT